MKFWKKYSFFLALCKKRIIQLSTQKFYVNKIAYYNKKHYKVVFWPDGVYFQWLIIKITYYVLFSKWRWTLNIAENSEFGLKKSLKSVENAHFYILFSKIP